MAARKRLALVAHDHCKREMLEWARYNVGTLSQHDLYATGTTGGLLAAELGLDVKRLLSGPLGGDQQVGDRYRQRRPRRALLLRDPLEPQPHDPDIKALLRITVLYNIPAACSRATADFILSSPLMGEPYARTITAPARLTRPPGVLAGPAVTVSREPTATES